MKTYLSNQFQMVQILKKVVLKCSLIGRKVAESEWEIAPDATLLVEITHCRSFYFLHVSLLVEITHSSSTFFSAKEGSMHPMLRAKKRNDETL